MHGPKNKTNKAVLVKSH